ncbi:hypothetical protein MHBO_000877 [Bonamia ostreae]|uniref:BRCT domain-containing protein n=1 Tax=Bonamia ostreae TaxID=126728 RepID=A0ABV2AHZ8_9EUKA
MSFFKSTADLLSVKKSKPSINYDHLVKERYPTFGEALEDMDDPLTLICLFLSVPARAVKGFGPEKSEDLQRLYDEFLHLTAIKGWLRKSFISLKGFYFQVDIDGHSITWLKPHKFTQNLENKKIDFNSLVAFLEFYHTLLKFVVYKLYKDQKMDYPPKFEQNITLKSNNNLFHNFVFLLSKETPYDVLEYIIKALGGKIYIETNVFDKMDKIKPLLTHKISDRPLFSASKTKDNFENVQSQYVFDCLNFGKILPVGDYLPGNKCPDHVSPFENFENLQIDQDAPKLENEDLNESEKKERLLDRIAAQKRTF